MSPTSQFKFYLRRAVMLLSILLLVAVSFWLGRLSKSVVPVSETQVKKTVTNTHIFEITTSANLPVKQLRNPKKPQFKAYRVVAGDTLSEITFDHFSQQVSYQTIAELNGITNPDLIYVDELVMLPILEKKEHENYINSEEIISYSIRNAESYNNFDEYKLAQDKKLWDENNNSDKEYYYRFLKSYNKLAKNHLENADQSTILYVPAVIFEYDRVPKPRKNCQRRP